MSSSPRFQPAHRSLKAGGAGLADPAKCDLCGGPCITLPSLGPAAMLSDGRRVEIPLAKLSCLQCAATSHVQKRSASEVRAAFDRDYSLGSIKGVVDVDRGNAYAETILGAIGDLRIDSVLDVGCGGGGLLQAIRRRHPDIRVVGLEAAGQAASVATAAGIKIQSGFAEDLEPPSRPFDLVCSVNVIEHTSDPLSFLRALGGQVTKDGRVVVVCPRADIPNIELLFFDHVHGLTPAAFARLASQAQLAIIGHVGSLPKLGDFQLFVLRRVTDSSFPAVDERFRGGHEKELAEARADYFEAWCRLDEYLEAAVAGRTLACFGATEAAALLRTYAPRTWARIDEMAVDDPSAAWPLGKLVVPYQTDRWPRGQSVVLAVHPARQDIVATRLEEDGFAPIPWGSAITR